jgi:cbb3-type cytochrome oxidase subunit 3
MIDLTHANAGLIGLLFFVSVFVVVVFWAFRPSQKKTIESYKYIPIVEDSDGPKR